MNPMVQASIKRLEETAERLDRAIEEQQSRLEEQRAAHEQALRQYWASGKDAAVMKANQASVEALQKHLEGSEALLATLREGLLRLLEQTKALREALRHGD